MVTCRISREHIDLLLHLSVRAQSSPRSWVSSSRSNSSSSEPNPILDIEGRVLTILQVGSQASLSTQKQACPPPQIKKLGLVWCSFWGLWKGVWCQGCCDCRVDNMECMVGVILCKHEWRNGDLFVWRYARVLLVWWSSVCSIVSISFAGAYKYFVVRRFAQVLLDNVSEHLFYGFVCCLVWWWVNVVCVVVPIEDCFICLGILCF